MCLMKSQFFPDTKAGRRALKLETKPHKDASNQFTEHRVYRHSTYRVYRHCSYQKRGAGGCWDSARSPK